MELRHLRAFAVVAEELNFRRAAERLGISQPPLSQVIKKLEREVGTALLARTTRRVTLTAAGEAFLVEARRALDAVQAATDRAREAAAGHSGHVRLGFTGPGSYQVLLDLARRFREQRPGVRLETVAPYLTGELLEMLHRGEIDAALVRLPVSTTGLRVREITRERFLVALPAEHRFADRTEITVPDLRDQPLIGYPARRGSVLTTAIHGAFHRHGMSPTIRQEAPDMHTAMVLAGAGRGVGLVLETARHLKVPGVVLVPLSGGPEVPLALAWREDDPGPALRAMVALLDDGDSDSDSDSGGDSGGEEAGGGIGAGAG